MTDHPPHTSSEKETQRIEAFSDGAFFALSNRRVQKLITSGE